ncbi:2-polyprenyl-3-methyl-6-methoxy-1,4-benzoquinone monooxygenase [Parapusillimonas granuli]|uniref:3-demethoxyubiquinol 3-hydroxylase n=1 Tax=Parapusillimonas granuli TaxID=380911 RepID=A0A853FXJ1_9BURK|nr:2-polyprenyl-3-methyl-6-methoxy-1,4-benzoquinone monooxygenase [Parapusillimonas granuli]MBB5215251.1 ubiquinone biosynthesis monooxygenase Coq7 [Parapusillimonas granuli]MEB2398414.1 2-polyprenyl-3-methyl-6-methoxy-1,4-benzoquinone monooxygenase [Alcaligenaceae bacterium]NYT49568.1 2-polyprenyl-3-methyl-6-methoxy-1,4-benzoquinone monooxygenase [Parapusillimonas granuli]
MSTVENSVNSGVGPHAVSDPRRLGTVDKLLSEIGRAVQILDGSVHASRPNPAGRHRADDHAAALTSEEQRHAAGLMRVNHVGEICAQALYRGQAMFCRDAAIRDVLYDAAAEEVDHLAWCRQRLDELHSRPSLLNPLWYAGSFALGMAASRAGTGRNLGFMAETERQVEQHLDGHLVDLPKTDERSRSIVVQMRDDEIQHRNTAETHGADALPAPVKLAMRFMSKVMTVTAYRI